MCGLSCPNDRRKSLATTKPELNTRQTTFNGQLDAKQSELIGIQLTMEPQELPALDGSASVTREPSREEV